MNDRRLVVVRNQHSTKANRVEHEVMNPLLEDVSQIDIYKDPTNSISVIH